MRPHEKGAIYGELQLTLQLLKHPITREWQ